MALNSGRKKTFWAVAFLLCIAPARAQQLPQVADSVRRAFNIPELGFAIISPDTITQIYLCGYHRAGHKTGKDSATASDYFHLGSNTKAITGFLAARLVEAGRISWTTRFFDLFPQWKKGSNPVYYNSTLADFLSHRAFIQPYTSGAEYHKVPRFKGNPSQRRAQFARYLLTQPPVPADSMPYHYSNAGYSIAALMLEKASGLTWEQLVQQVVKDTLGLRYSLGWPNRISADQPWGHWAVGDTLQSVPPSTDYDLNLREPAGDISMPLADYARFIQINLQGLEGRNNFLKAGTYNYLHFGVDGYAIGWGNGDIDGRKITEHAGSAGTFYCYTLIDKDRNFACIVVANSGLAEEGVQCLVAQILAR